MGGGAAAEREAAPAASSITTGPPPHSSSSSLPPPAHRTDADEDDDNVKQLGDCSTLYIALQECLIRTDRDWRSCQQEVQALKVCNVKRSKSKEN